MKLEPQKKVSPPKAWLYDPILKLVAFGCRRMTNMELDNSTTRDFSGPAVMVGAHAGMLDFMFTASAFPNRRLNYVGSEHYFRMKRLRPLLEALGVISKLQFYPDVQAIKNMMRITKQGGIVAIFPAGQTSMCGVPAGIEPGIARLIQKLNVPVIAACAHGSFFTKGRFHGQRALGKCIVETKIILTPDQLSKMTTDEIYAAITAGINYDEYEWQAQTNIEFCGKNRIKGYQFITYKCPKCGEEYTMDCDGTRIWCTSCGNAASVNSAMRFVPENQDCVIFDTLRDWYSWQLDFIKNDTASADFCMRERVVLRALSPKSKFVECGEGEIMLTHETISYNGTYFGRDFSYSVKNSVLPGLMGDTGAYFEIFNPCEGPLRFYPSDGHAVAKWKQTQEYIYYLQTCNATTTTL